MVNRLELLPEDLDGSGSQRIATTRAPISGHDSGRLGILVETIAAVVDGLRLVAPADRVRLHDNEIGERRDSQAHRIRRPGDHDPFELDALRASEGGGACGKLQDAEALHELRVVFLQLHVSRGQELTATCTGASPSSRYTVVTS